MRLCKSIFTIRLWIPTILSFCFALLYASFSLSADLTLAWDCNSESNLEGYKIYYLTASPDGWDDGNGLAQGASPITVPLDDLETATAPSFQLSGLTAGESYHFSVTAYNKGGNESDFSNLVRYDVPMPGLHSLVASASGRGEILPAGIVNAADGSSKTFVITADTNYHIADVIVDGSSVGPVSTCAFINIDGPHTISAVFEANTFIISDPPNTVSIYATSNTFPISATSIGKGDITPGGVSNIEFGSSQMFTLRPYSNHHVADVLVDGKSVGPVANYTFDSVSGPHTIHAVFKTDTFTIASSVTGNGSISSDGINEAAFGSDLLCTISPDAGYQVTDVKVDGISVGTVTQYTFSNIRQDHVIEAYFEKAIEGFFMEVGEVNVNHNWQQVHFSRTFLKPVVVASTLSFNDDEPAVVRIDRVTATGFEISVQEWDYLDNDHLDETVGYIVMEAGSFTLPDGTKVEAGIFKTNGTFDIHRLILDNDFRLKPVVAASVISFNNPNTVTMRLQNISTTGFDYQIQEEEEASQRYYSYLSNYLSNYYNLYNSYNPYNAIDLSNLPSPYIASPETISYIAWEPCRTKLFNATIEVGKTEKIMNDFFKTITFTNPFDAAPVFFAAMQTRNASDTASLRWDELNNCDVQVKVEEEKSLDQEISHKSEVVGYFAIVPDRTLSTE